MASAPPTLVVSELYHPACARALLRFTDAGHPGRCKEWLPEGGLVSGQDWLISTSFHCFTCFLSPALTGARVTEPAPVGGMGIPLRHEVLVHVLVVIRLVRPILVVVARSDRDLASQVRRATSSIGNNVAEGFGTQHGNARVRFETARGSLYEMEAGLQMAAAWGYVTDAEIAAALVEIRSLGARIYGLSKKQ